MKNIILFSLTIILLSSCKLVETIKLRSVSTQMVNLSELGDAWGGIQKMPDVKKNEIYFLKLNFSSTSDLLKFARSKGVHLSFTASLCSSDGSKVLDLFVLPGLRAGDLSFDTALSSPLPDLEGLREKDKTIVYNVLIPIAGHELKRLLGGVSIADRVSFFEMQASNENICLQVHAGAMWFGQIDKSNTIMFSRAQIKEAEKLGSSK